MYTQHCELKGAAERRSAMPLEKPGPTVKLIAQTGEGQVVYMGAGDAEPSSLPSHEFFAMYREAYPNEVAEFEKAANKKLAVRERADT